MGPAAERVEFSIGLKMGSQRCLPYCLRDVGAFAADPMKIAMDLVQRRCEVEDIPVGDRRIDRALERVQPHTRIAGERMADFRRAGVREGFHGGAFLLPVPGRRTAH